MENINEIWKDIVGYEGLYQVSSFGRVKSLSRIIMPINGRNWVSKERILKPSYDRDGYLHTSLTKDKKPKNYFVHRLVAIAFIQNPLNKLEVNHINGIKNYNFDSNLEWVTNSENRVHAYSTGLQKGAVGIKQHMSKLNEKKVLEIRKINKTMTQENIAKIYGVNFRTISNVLLRKTWRHIK